VTRQRALPGTEGPDDLAEAAEAEILELDAARADQRSDLRELLGDKPDEFTWSEWRVVYHLLAPDPHMVPGTVNARRADARAARECFPGLALPAAIRAYREARDSRRVREFVADFRALEAAPLFDLRARARQVLLDIAETPAGVTPAGDPEGWARASATRVAAVVALMKLDGLEAGGAAELAAARATGDAGADLPARIGRAAAAYAERAKAAAKAPAGDGS
jgi:hypothetical protein